MISRSRTLWIALVVGYFAAGPLWGQVVRLPAVMPASEPYPVRTASRLVSRPDSPAELPQPSLGLLPAPDPDRPPDARDGMFQKLIFTYEWLAAGGNDGLGIHDVELKTILALPIPSRRWPLLITPGFAVHYLEGPVVPDLPARVYDAYTQFRSLGRINPRLGVDLAVTLGAFSDFQQGSDEAFRITGHGAAMWEWTTTMKVVLGAAYIDTPDADVIPVCGLIWSPHEDFTLEAVFPRPKVAHRVYWPGACTEDVQDWVYVAGEFGNDTWAIRRAGGTDDEVNYRDWRVVLGLERKAVGRLDARLELAYVFSRELKYKSATPDLDLADTVMLRAGVTY